MQNSVLERLPGVIFANRVNLRRNCWGGGRGGGGGGYDRLVMNLEYLVFKIEQRKMKKKKSE